MQYIYAFDYSGLEAWLAYLPSVLNSGDVSLSLDASALSNGIAGRLNLLDAPPTLYGFRGCRCLANYYRVLTQDKLGVLSLDPLFHTGT